MMDKLDRREWEGHYDKGSPLGKHVDKQDELIEGYNEIMRRLDGLERRMEALSSIAIKGRNEY